MSTLIVNLFGGPGSGKSTLAAQVFANLKYKYVNCELVTEVAKDHVWANNLDALQDQIFILGNQHNRIFRLIDKVDVVITDSPLLLSYTYGVAWGADFQCLVVELFKRYKNLNYLLQRTKSYQQVGRVQDAEGAKELDSQIEALLERHAIPYRKAFSAMESGDKITEEILERIKIVD